MHEVRTIEAGWERGTDAAPPSSPALEAALEEWLGGRTLLAASVLPGGLVNLNIAVTAAEPRETCVLRVHLRGADAAVREAAVLAHVAEHVPAPRVLGQGTIGLDEGPRSFLLVTRLPGEALAGRLGDADAVLARAGREVGAALARVHAHRYARAGFLDARLQVPAPFPDLVGAWRNFVGAALAGRAGRQLGARRKVLERLVGPGGDALGPLEGRFALLHADCKPTNVLVDGTGALTGLLDWEYAWAGPPLFDLGQMLRWPLPPAYEVAFVETYAHAAGPLPEGWRRQARLLDLMNLLGFLDREGPAPVRERDVLRLVDRTLAAEAAS